MNIDWYDMLIAAAIGIDLGSGRWYQILIVPILVWVLWNRHHRKVMIAK